MFRFLPIALLLAVPVSVLAQEPGDPEPKKEKKKDRGKKDGPRGPAFPDIDKLLPPDLPAETREQIRKHYEEMKKRMQNFPGGGFPGAGFPPGGFPGAFPPGGGPPGGFPAMPGGMPGMSGMAGMSFMMMNPRLGAAIEAPSPTLIAQLDLTKKQGIVVRELLKDSAADKAGFKSHDILWELDGKPVPSKMDAFVKMLQKIKPEEKVDAVVIRKGKKVTVKDITLPEGRGFPNFAPGGFRPPAGIQAPGANPGAVPNPGAGRRPE